MRGLAAMAIRGRWSDGCPARLLRTGRARRPSLHQL